MPINNEFKLPYRGKHNVEKQLGGIGVGYGKIKEFDDCTVVDTEK
jgi:hypothetical protein